jgi:hypothetical protein
MRRWGGAKEVVSACNMSNFITDEVINVDGGWDAW